MSELTELMELAESTESTELTESTEFTELKEKLQETKLLAVIGKLLESMVYDITQVSYQIDDKPVRLKLRTKDGSSFMLMLVKESSGA